MPRTYVKPVGKQSYLNYTPETISAAVKSIEMGANTIRKAAHQYGIPYGTIYNRIHGLFTRKYGGQTALNASQERELCDTILLAGEWGFPLTQSDIKFLVKSYFDANNCTSRFKENLPGRDWISSFLSRNKDKVSTRLSQNIKRTRAKVSPATINEYFDKLATTVQDVPPENIMNYDEINFTDDPESKAVVVRKGQKHVENILDHSKTSFSVMFAGAADGTVLPPYIVYAALHLYPTWTEGGPSGARYNRTKSGSFDTTIFEDWFFSIALTYFKKLKNDTPKVIIGDNVASHVSYRVFKSCLDNNIRFVFLPPNATHLCQPLDVSFFRPLKKSWKLTLENWKKRNRGCIPKHIFPGLLKAAIGGIEESNAQNMRSGFKATGIYPLNRTEVLKRVPGGTIPDAINETTPKCSFSEQLMTLLKRERYGESIPRNIPKRRRLIEIQPGESVTEQQAKDIINKKELSTCVENINPDVNSRKGRKVKQEKDEVSISYVTREEVSKHRGMQSKSIATPNECLNEDETKKTEIKQEKDDNSVPSVDSTTTKRKRGSKKRSPTILVAGPKKRASRIRC